MVGNDVAVDFKDGTTQQYEVTISAMCTWEDQYPDMAWTEWVRKQSFKPLAFLGWSAMQDSGVTVKPFKEWLRTIKAVRLVPKADDE